MSTQWNPDLYLKFQQERTQPSRDLVFRIDLESPQTIVDVGCGPGNSTQVIKDRWPQARVIGTDNSTDMIAAAQRDYPEGEWVLVDARELGGHPELPTSGTYDIVYSNAVIQWIPNHESLLSGLMNLLAPGGVLALQIPLFGEMPMRDAIVQVAAKDRWRDRMEGAESALVYYPTDFYYETLSRQSSSLSLWTTWYIHEMESHDVMMDMMRSTGMRPFLECLDQAEQAEFVAEVRDAAAKAYPPQKNGRVLYPFKRHFIVAYK